MTRRLAPLLLAALLLAAPAHASLEQFETFDVLAPEVDDENAIDYFLLRGIESWKAEWDTSATAFRTDQGCMTAGTWYQANELKARSPLGTRSWFELGLVQHTDPATSYEWLQLDFMHRAGRAGAFGLRFRPAADKAAQDFALLWALGDARSRFQARATLSIEDTFNKLWTFRQTQVGEHRLAPYRRHPFEPGFEFAWRGARHRVELLDEWLTPMTQDVIDPDPAVSGTLTLRGHRARLLAERSAGAWTGLVRYELTYARSTRTSGAAPGDGRVDRQQWGADLGLRRRLGERLAAEGHYFYQARAQDWRPPAGEAAFHALDRVGELEATYQLRMDWQLRAGLLYDRVGVARAGEPPGFTYGSRKESRGIVGLQARLGRVRFQATECIELDSEPYEVTFHHDKGFLHLQTSF